jgi:activator of HSP90 ATPase
MKTKDIKQEEHFDASPAEIYDALMDSKKHTQFTGDTAKIENKVGGNFTAFSGYASGKNLELIQDKKIVQSWHAEEENWPDDYFSKITFELKPDKGGTLLNFTHEGVPVENADSIADGWVTYYWEPLREMVKKKG